MFRLILGFLNNPFDPVRNALLLSVIERLLPDPELSSPADVDDAVEQLRVWRVILPAHVKLPEPEQIRVLWDRLGPRARALVCTHDASHWAWECAQDVAGEYELATLLLFRPDEPLDRLYGALALPTLPLGTIRSPDGFLAPTRGVLRGLGRLLFEDL